MFSGTVKRGVGQGQSFNRDHGAGANEKIPVSDHGPEGTFFPVNYRVAAVFSGAFCDVIPWRAGMVPDGMLMAGGGRFWKRLQCSDRAARITD